MINEYNLSLIFYPQDTGRYTVICPELPSCVAEGKTIEEATANIRNIIADFLPDEIENEVNEETFRVGLCMKGKLFQEMTVTVDASGEVVFPSEALAHAVGAEG